MSVKREITVVGGGTAGLIAATTLLRLCPDTNVTVIRSTELGHIMVGEGTFAGTPDYLHDVMGIPLDDFYAKVNPIWKLGVRLKWGPRPYFDYPFNEQFDNQILPSKDKPWGYYHLDEYESASLPAGATRTPPAKRFGYHIENQPFVAYLEQHFARLGGKLVDAKVASVEVGEIGVESLVLESGDRHTADFFVDASGFRAELINKGLGEPFVSMRDHLFCDRAVVGGWARGDEEIRPYTSMDTMDAGWCWRIDHEHTINRGYVHSSAYISVDEAADELARKNPKIDRDSLRVVPFEARHVRHPWVKNVVAIGNACGFVEPLEATNIQVICAHSRQLAEAINAGGLGNSDLAQDYNESVQLQWEDIRDFLALHYRFNTRLNTPFWQMAVRNTPLGGLEEYVKLYQENGPVLFTGSAGKPGSMFGYDGHLNLLLGLQVPWKDGSVR
ncbi:tryptophan 7-halogenase [Streptomyces monomycini]|uniref:tryptophan 7-halogenase n=1 Tax=Streptomyces monomycini TaxID=371720 RepID=UPI0004AAB800|nr:tryptophan 7-halogenase [Streptomyces monomycini]